MSKNLGVAYPGQVVVDTDYPYGGAQDVAVPGDNTGTPWQKELINDILGLQQALLVAAGITPSNIADKVAASQYLQCLIELASGRAYTYDETGAANAYVLAARTNQQLPASLFAGLTVVFTPGNSNTAASTLQLGALAVKDLLIGPGAGVALTDGQLIAGVEYKARYNGTAWLIPEEHRRRLIGQRTVVAGTSLVASDAGGIVYFTSATAQNCAVNTGIFKANDVVTIIQEGAGQITLTGTATARTSATLITDVQYSAITLIFKSATEYTVLGERVPL